MLNENFLKIHLTLFKYIIDFVNIIINSEKKKIPSKRFNSLVGKDPMKFITFFLFPVNFLNLISLPEVLCAKICIILCVWTYYICTNHKRNVWHTTISILSFFKYLLFIRVVWACLKLVSNYEIKFTFIPRVISLNQ